MGRLLSTAVAATMLMAGAAFAQSSTTTVPDSGVRTATPPAAHDATRQNSQTIAPGDVRRGTNVPMTSGGGDSSSAGSGSSSGGSSSGSAGGSSSGSAGAGSSGSAGAGSSGSSGGGGAGGGSGGGSGGR